MPIITNNMAFLLLLIIFLHVHKSVATEPVFEPEVLSDGTGNEANKDSVISWAAVPRTTQYQTMQEYSADGLQPLFDFANSFIDTVQPNDFPYEIAAGMKNNTEYVSKHTDEISDYMLGFFVCLALGLLLAVVIIVSGVTFCCCRLLGRCGGNRSQKLSDSRAIYRHIYAVALAVTTVFLGVGMICTYVTNDRLSAAIDDVEHQINTNLVDMVTYLDSTINEIDHATRTNYNFSADVINRDLHNLDSLIGVPVRDGIDQRTHLIAALDDLNRFNQIVENVYTKLLHMDDSVSLIQMNGNILSLELQAVITSLAVTLSDPSCVGCGDIQTDDLAMNINFSQLPNISSQIASIQSVRNENISALITQAKTDFNDIPAKVRNETLSTVTDIERLITEFYGVINNEVSNIEDLPLEIKEEMIDIQNEMLRYHDDVEHYNYYRWAVGVTLTCVVLVIVLLQACGVTMGTVSRDNHVLPTERSTTSNLSGLLLLSATAHIFLFSWLLLILCSLSLLVGGNIRTIVCEPLLDPQYDVIQKLFDSNDSILGPPGGYFMGEIVLGNKSVDLTVSGLLKDCEANKPAYEALKLSTQFDINKITQYNQSIDVESELNNLQVDFSDFVILTPELRALLVDFSSSALINYTAFQQQLDKDTTVVDLEEYSDNLLLASGLSTDPARSELNSAARTLQEIHNGIYKTVRDDQSQLIVDIEDLESDTHNIPSDVETVIELLTNLELNASSVAEELIKQYSRILSDRLVGVIDSFSTQAKQSIETAGRCKPLWNLYHSLFQTSICRYSIDAFNGFWFSISWCLVFMIPSLLLNIKLSKYYRRMKYSDNYDDINKVKPSDP